jgi:selenocysteine lyase/cysteine desulfurase
MLTCQKHLFDIPEDVTYLNCAYMGPLPRVAAEAGQRGIKVKQEPWKLSTDDFFPEVKRSKELFAVIIGANAQDISIAPSASYGIATAAKNLTIKPGQSIVVLDEQFPSNVYSWRRKAAENGATIKFAKRREDYDWAASIIEQIDENTALVATGNVHWTDGSVIDLVKVSAACKAVGAALVIDGTQSIGVQPLDVKAIRPDFVAVGVYKWMLGPYSYAYLYSAPWQQKGVPLEENWITRKGSGNFAGLVDYVDDYGPGAERYDQGERSNFILTPMTVASLELFQKWTVPAVAEYIEKLTDKAAAAAGDLGLSVAPKSARSPHMLGIRLAGQDPQAVAAKMAEAKVMVSVRGTAVRLAPHVFNDESDIDRFFNVLEGCIRS